MDEALFADGSAAQFGMMGWFSVAPKGLLYRVYGCDLPMFGMGSR